MNFAKKKLYQLNSTILITGETGCGKSRLAREIHRNSLRSNSPFITANLATISENLFESELFGHVKGAFTGALGDKKGLCEIVGKGILFLDEIGELPLQSQKKLLYLLEEKKFMPVGSGKEKKFEGQVIAATNRDIGAMVYKNEFRSDLYYRLRIFEFKMPPLRSDPDKLRELYTKILHEKGITEQNNQWQGLEKSFSNYRWPGNVRELLNCIEYYVAIGELPSWMNVTLPIEPALGSEITYGAALRRFEKNFLNRSLRQNCGAINKTAREIKISKTTLLTKLRKYDIDYNTFKKNKRVRVA